MKRFDVMEVNSLTSKKLDHTLRVVKGGAYFSAAVDGCNCSVGSSDFKSAASYSIYSIKQRTEYDCTADQLRVYDKKEQECLWDRAATIDERGQVKRAFYSSSRYFARFDRRYQPCSTGFRYKDDERIYTERLSPIRLRLVLR